MRTCARSSPSTVSPSAWSTRSARATRLLAYATLALFATKNSVIASVLGSLAAAIECEHEGNVPVGRKDVVDKLYRFERFMNYQ